MAKNLRTLSEKLGYIYQDLSLLDCALRHRSVGKPHNERLEYLGDSLLNFIIAEKVYHMFPKAAEGELTRLRASLVNKQSLSDIAFNLKLDQCVELGPGEKKSGGYRRESILADALEAIFASLYLDGGMDALKTTIEKLYAYRFETLSVVKLGKDPKTTLQEWLQANKRTLPHYEVISSDHDGQISLFVVQCFIEGLEPIVGEGKNRRFAEQDAAQKALELLHVS